MSSSASSNKEETPNNNSSKDQQQQLTTTTTTTTTNMELSQNDRRQYRALTLPENELRLLLMSDPATDLAAAACAVGVGQLQDGSNSDSGVDGCAHLCEHLVFLGSKPFPNENDYDQYLSQAGGHSNAFTDLEVTCYYMDCQAPALQGALQRMAASLAQPLLRTSSLERELQAVDSEHGKNVTNDHWRALQLSKTLLGGGGGGGGGGSINQNDASHHAYAGFGTGNLESLLGPGDASVDKKERLQQLQQAVSKFYHRYYKGCNMTLCVLGRETLDELETMVRQNFEAIASAASSESSGTSSLSSCRPEPIPPLPALGQLPVFVEWIPTRETITLEMQWPCPQVQTLWRSKPSRYLSHLLGHEGPGSLLHALRDLQWAQELGADDASKSCRDFSVFLVQIELTQAGLQNLDTVLQMVHAYIQLIAHEVPEWVYDELVETADMQFRFLSQQPPAETVAALSGNMQHYPVEQYYAGPYRVYEWKPDAVRDCLSYLRPDNLLVLVSSKSFASSDDDNSENKMDQKDPWYGTEYRQVSLDPSRIEKWSQPLPKSLAERLSLPDRNDMLATKFDLVFDEKKNDPRDRPQCLIDSETLRLWYKPDDKFQMPKVNLLALFRTDAAYAESLQASVLASLWSEVVHEHCNVFSYAASMAGLHCDFATTRAGMELHVVGYNHKASILLQRIVDAIVEMPSKLTDDQFERIADKLTKQYHAFLVGHPYSHAIYLADLCLETPKWKVQDKIECLRSELTRDDLVHYASHLLSRFALEVLVHGNVTPSEAIALSAIFTKGFEPKPPFSLQQVRVVRLEPGKDYVCRVANFHEEDANNCLSVTYQMGPLDVRTNATLSLLHHLVREPAFNQLRTEEQLGYIVHTQVKTNGDNVKGLLILIQSDAFDPIFLDERVEVFLEGFRTRLVQISDEDFQANVESVCQNLLQKDKNLGEESSKYWHVIQNRSYRFRRLQEIAAEVKHLTKADVLRMFDRYILRKSPYRQKFSVQIFGNGCSDKISQPSDSAVMVKNMSDFSRGHLLYPVQTEISIEQYMEEHKEEALDA